MKNENQAKRNFRFNFIDVILILIVLSVAAVLVYIFASDRIEVARTQQQSTDIMYEIEVASALQEYKGLIQIGDKMLDSNTQTEIGEVVNVVYSEVKYEGHASDGSVVYSTHPERVKIVITVKAKAQLSSDGIYTVGGDYELLIGKNIFFRVPDFVNGGYCISIKEASDNE